MINLAVLFLAIFLTSPVHAQTTQQVNIDLNKIMIIESSGNPGAWNKRDDSRGLFQITPICLKEYNNFHLKNKYNMDDLWDVSINTRIAYWYINKRIPQMLKHYGEQDTVDNRIIAYNCGISCVIKDRIPPVTKQYLVKYKRIK